MSIAIGQPAPDFELPNQFGQPVRLSDFRGKKVVVLVFYPFAFTGVCTGELCSLRDEAADFVTEGVETLAISCDPVPSLKRDAAKAFFKFAIRCFSFASYRSTAWYLPELVARSRPDMVMKPPSCFHAHSEASTTSAAVSGVKVS